MEEQLHNQVEGVVSSIIFQNEENGYTILRMNAGQGDITAVGCMPGAAPGETLVLRGTWVRHPSYGEQFKEEVVERRLPQGLKEVFHYLASGVVRGIGQSTARRMVEMFGEDALTVLESEPEKLTQIRGISLKRAKAMSEDFRQQMGMRLLLAFLSDHGLNVQLGAALYRQWGNVALEVVKNDPYVLINEEWGVDFSRADALAADLGMAAENTSRLDAALIFELTHNMNNGHTFLPRGKLLQATCQLTGVGESALVKRLDDLLQHGGLTQEDVAGEEAIYLEEMHRAECSVAERLHTMSRRSLTPPAHMDGLLEQIQQELDIRYAPEQLRAVELAASSQVMLLTGGPGTGKTTTLRGVLALFDRLGLNTALAAPTGRAANRLGELCRAEASTIHRMLEPGIDPYTGRLVFSKNGDEPLDVDAVIVDETSMVDITLMSALLDALGDDCRLILVGDPDQLPSVGPGCVFSDLIRSRTVPAVCLTEIFRQAAQSAIVRNAHQVNGGVLPDLKENDNDFFFLSRKDPVAACQTIVDLCRRRLKNLRFILRLGKQFTCVKQDLRAVRHHCRLSRLLFIANGKGRRNVSRQEHNEKRHRVTGFIGRQTEPRCGKKIVKNQNTGHRRQQTVDSIAHGNGCQQNTQQIHHDDRRFAEVQTVEQYTDQCNGGQNSNTFKGVQADCSKVKLIRFPRTVCRLSTPIRDDMDIDIGCLGDQLFCQRWLSQPVLS